MNWKPCAHAAALAGAAGLIATAALARDDRTAEREPARKETQEDTREERTNDDTSTERTSDERQPVGLVAEDSSGHRLPGDTRRRDIEVKSGDRERTAPGTAAVNLKGLIPLSDPPFKGHDLDNREYSFMPQHAPGIQVLGFDIALVAWRDGRWSYFKDGVSDADGMANPDNAKSRSYRRPVYAMDDGVVVACWRNAPNNPRYFTPNLDSVGEEEEKPECEDVDWLHPELCSGGISGGGNYLWLKGETGIHTLYAHLEPGTIPKEICPHNAQYFNPKITDEKPPYGPPQSPPSSGGVVVGPAIPGGVVSDLPQDAVDNGKEIKKDDFLGLVGNSGSSSAPHLHVHKELYGAPIPIHFEHGIYAPFYRNPPSKADYFDPDVDIGFKPLDGKQVPRDFQLDADGETIVKDLGALVWPPRTPIKNFGRGGIPAGRFQDFFEHLVDSGMWPGRITCNVASGQIYYSVYDWNEEPDGADWFAKHGMTETQRNIEVINAAAAGYDVAWSDYCDIGGGELRYVVVFKK